MTGSWNELASCYWSRNTSTWLAVIPGHLVFHCTHIPFLGKDPWRKRDTNKTKPSVPHGSIYQCKKLAFNIWTVLIFKLSGLCTHTGSRVSETPTFQVGMCKGGRREDLCRETHIPTSVSHLGNWVGLCSFRLALAQSCCCYSTHLSLKHHTAPGKTPICIIFFYF